MASRDNPVTWLLGNREVLAVLFVAVAWLAQKLGITRDKRAVKPPAPNGPGSDTGEEERTRRVQEDIRRRIAERRAGTPPVFPASRSAGEPAPPVVAPRPVAAPPIPWGGMFEPKSEEAREEATIAQGDDPGAVPARQRALEEKMRLLESASSAASAKAGSYSAGGAADMLAQLEPAVAATPPSFAWLSELRDRQGARRGIILREVLGPPVGLRR
jgi:hypothetical protein